MCGIAGALAAAPTVRVPQAAQRLTEALRHRGPDAGGLHSFRRCILGHRRLSIVDLARGAQPLLSHDGRVAITFNGAIYGFHEIRRSLESEYHFHTDSDTEVILALYARHGRRLVEHLPGMFAFAIWDDRTQTLFAARDRLGQKPFYFARVPEGAFLFASELKAILATGLVRREVDRRSLAHALDRRCVPVDRTIWQNIETLPPAHTLTFEDSRVRIERYWDLPPTEEPVSVEAAIEELRRRFEHAIETHLVADVPIASFLSGGLDSSTVVAVASRHRPGIRTVSFGFSGDASELAVARQTASRHGTSHIEIEDRDFDVADLLVRMAGIFDEPHADLADVPTYLVCRAAREHAIVILTGEGGDELFGGYPFWYQPLREMERWLPRPLLLRRIGSLSARIARRLGVRPDSRTGRWLQGAALARRFSSITEAHRQHMGLMGRSAFERLELPLPDVPAPKGNSGTVDDALRADLTGLLPGLWLTRVDRTSMANGMELRSPFLDTAFADFCISLPSRLKVTKTEEKWILRRAYEHEWTQAVRTKKKQGFSQDVGQWIARPELEPLKRRILDDPSHRLYELLPFDPMRSLAATNARRTWTALALGLWAETWL